MKAPNKIYVEVCEDGIFAFPEAPFKESVEYIRADLVGQSLQQEQPEVDLEKFTEKIKTFQARYKHPEIVSIKGAMAFMARMFYQYPNVAMEWYERLPKVTMD